MGKRERVTVPYSKGHKKVKSDNSEKGIEKEGEKAMGKQATSPHLIPFSLVPSSAVH